MDTSWRCGVVCGAQRRMASEDGSPYAGSAVCGSAPYVLNAGWRLRMVHKAGDELNVRPHMVLNAGWRLRMVHERDVIAVHCRSRVLNAGWRLRMVHFTQPLLRLRMWRLCAQRRMASEDGSLDAIGSEANPK